MESNFQKIKNYLLELNYSIINEDPADEVFVVDCESEGIKNLVIGCADPILIMEQYIFEIRQGPADLYKSLLMKNRDIIHGAFVLDESGTKVIFRDTLQLQNLDMNELQSSIKALSLLLSEYSDEIIRFSKN